jgi:DNA-directed RNA polymerase specialized sigma24 family protein
VPSRVGGVSRGWVGGWAGSAGSAGDGDPGELAVGADEARLLRAAIRDLPEGPRRALVLAVFGGRTAQEVSEVEGIPLGTAKTRIRAAVLRLRAALDPTESRP